jgi:uncharacterized membrane protein YccC
MKWASFGIQVGFVCALISLCIMPYGFASSNNELLIGSIIAFGVSGILIFIWYYIMHRKINRQNAQLQNLIYENPVIVIVHPARPVRNGIKSSDIFYTF